MRKHVRFQPLGTRRMVVLHLPRNRKRDAIVVDESAEGIGVELPEDCAIDLGTKIEVEAGGEKHTYTVMRVDRLGETATRVGLKLVS